MRLLEIKKLLKSVPLERRMRLMLITKDPLAPNSLPAILVVISCSLSTAIRLVE